MNIKAIIETAIYVDDLDRTETFYRTILGLTVIAKESGRHVFSVFHRNMSSIALRTPVSICHGRSVRTKSAASVSARSRSNLSRVCG